MKSSLLHSLLVTKLYIPPVRKNQVPRPRLVQALNAAWQPGCKLVLVSAPAGYGKTTLVTEWLGSLTPDPSPKGGGEFTLEGGGEFTLEGGGEFTLEGGGELAPEGGGELAPEGGGELAPEGGGELALEGAGGLTLEGGGGLHPAEWTPS